MRAPGNSIYERTSYVARQLKTLAKVTNAAVMMLSQVSRKAGDGTEPITLEHGRDSGAIEEGADFLIGMWRDDTVENLIHAQLLKARRGGSGIFDKITMADEKRVDGHAPDLGGRDLCAYVAAGVGSDHEGTTVNEVAEKLRLGMHIMMREGSLTKNLKNLIPVITPYNISRCFFVTDDRHPKDILDEGHIDFMVRTAVDAGIKPVSAVRLATINCAEYFKLDKLGALAPGFAADVLVLDSLDKMSLGMNVAYLVGHNSIRKAVMNMDNRAPTVEELAMMKFYIAI